MRIVGGWAFGYDHGSLGRLCTYESSLCEGFRQTPKNRNRFSGQNLAKHHQTWFGLLICPDLSSTQKLYQLPVLERAELGCVGEICWDGVAGATYTLARRGFTVWWPSLQ